MTCVLFQKASAGIQQLCLRKRWNWSRCLLLSLL